MTGLMNTLKAGDQIDSYRIAATVSRNQISTIYRAIDIRDGRVVALKVPDPEMETDPLLLERFRRAASIGEKLHHDGVMRVYSEVERSRVYMVMEWCDGKTLRQLMNDGTINTERAISISIAILEALHYLHDNGIVHRALTPNCVMVEEHDTVKIIDFGLASDAAARRITYTNLSGDLGTIDYIAPEQVSGKRGDHRADIYAMGVILYEMVTGKLPFEGSSSIEVMKARLTQPPIPPDIAAPGISPHLQEVIFRALETDPKNRYARAQDFAHDLKNLDQVSIESRPEFDDWRRQKARLPRTLILFTLLFGVPAAILLAMIVLGHPK